MSTQFRWTRLALAVAATTTLWACSDGDTATSVIDSAPPTAEAPGGNKFVPLSGPAAEINVFDLTIAGASATVQGATFTNIDPVGSTGTGVITPFVQLAPGGGLDFAVGVNTSGKPKPYNEGNSANFNRDLPLELVPQVDCDGLPGGDICREFIVDINEVDSGNEALLSLDAWITFIHRGPGFSGNDINTGTFPSDPCADGWFTGVFCEVVYDLDGDIVDDGSGATNVALMLNYTLNPGSGDGDNRILIPDFGPGDEDCSYGSTTCTTFLSVYSEYGLTPGDPPGDYDGFPGEGGGGGTASDGFEENTVRSLAVLDVVKDVTTRAQPSYTWDVEKTVTPESWALFDGESAVSDYTVTATKTLTGDYANWSAYGTIEITNTGDQVAPIIALIDDGYIITCPGGNPSEGSPVVLEEGESIICDWESGPLADDSDFENTAQVTVDDPDFEGIQYNQVFQSNTVFWSTSGTPDEDILPALNDGATLDDSWDGTGAPDNEDLSDGAVFNYSRTFTCSDVPQVDNTATLVDDLGNEFTDDATVTIACYDISVTKDADESFERTWTWDVDKNADQTELVLQPQQTFDVNYTVDVFVTGYTDDKYRVQGDITISNSHPTRVAVLTQVVDEITGFGGNPIPVDCLGVTEVPAAGNIVCTYDTGELASMPGSPNTATATQQLYDFASDGSATANGTDDESGSWPVDFGEAVISEIDECVDISDTHPEGPQTQLCQDAAPGQFNYTVEIGPFSAEQCGQAFVDNTATIVTNDQLLEDEALWQVVIEIPCPSCTLTQGYWKTHNDAFWGGAPSDPTWAAVGGPNAPFFSSTDGSVNKNLPAGTPDGSYIDAMWTAPAGNMYWQLARQYIAAELNQAAFGSLSGIYLTAFNDATTLLSTYTQAQVGADSDLNSQAQQLASILDEYNNGGDSEACTLDPVSVSQIALSIN